MKVKELQQLLKHMDPEAEVVLAGDPEGNWFRAADGYSTGWWEAAEKELHDAKMKAPKGAIEALVLWP